MKKVYYKSELQKLPKEELITTIKSIKDKLIGSAIFSNNNSITSKVVQFFENLIFKKKGFTPSHTGSIIEYNNDIYLFDMKPLKAKIQLLSDYILNTKDNFVLVLKDFDIDNRMFSLNISNHIGEFYPFLSAIRSICSKKQSKWRTHCSELHLRELQLQGLFKDINPEITPLELLQILIK